MPGNLTSRERMRRALRGQPTDRPALAYLFLGGARHVLGHVGRRMNEAYGDPHLMAATQAAAAELFEHDSAMVPWGCLTVEAEAFGCRIEKLEDYYPRVTGRPLEEDRNLARLSDPDPSSSGRMPLVLDALSRLRQRSGDDLFIVALVVSPFLVACELRGMAKLLTDFINDPPYVESLFQRVTEGTERYLLAILRTGACDAVLFENPGVCRELMGPHHLDRFVLPYHRRLLETARREAPEVFLIEHNCSNTPYLEEILELDIDAISFAYGDVRAIGAEHGWDCHAKHTSANACLDRYCLRPRDTARAVAWVGNVDNTQVLLGASPEEVFREARACIESARGAPFVLSTGCEIPFKAPAENIRALARAARAGH
ncbi:MAG: uroporphyrinogen decarboxylase family protein [Rhodospirillales bacterium]|nr:uroporphyrinogen decarboxylase family protein [Rhodospirillales bacterium]